MYLKSALLDIMEPDWESQLCQYVGENKQNFLELMDCFFSTDSHLTQRATLIMLASVKDKPEWVAEQVPRLVKALDPDLPVSLKRNILRILQHQVIPELLWGHAADQCFNYLISTDEPVAIKAFSMTVIYNLSRQVPDLALELRLLIEDQYYLGSAGFKARGRKVLSQLQKDGY